MRATLSVLLLLLAGCGAKSEIHFPATDTRPAMDMTHVFHGKGCIAIDATGESLSIIVQEAGSDDWSQFRLFAVVSDSIRALAAPLVAFFAKVPAQADSSDPTELAAPTYAEGCEGLFVADEPDLLIEDESVVD